MYITIHVDNSLIIGSNDVCNRFNDEICKVFSVKRDGPCNSERWECQYLKTTMVCAGDGLIVEPNKQYIPKLVDLLKVEKA